MDIGIETHSVREQGELVHNGSLDALCVVQASECQCFDSMHIRACLGDHSLTCCGKFRVLHEIKWLLWDQLLAFDNTNALFTNNDFVARVALLKVCLGSYFSLCRVCF